MHRYAQKLASDVRGVLIHYKWNKHVRVDSVEMRQILAPTPAGVEWVVKLRVVSTASLETNFIIETVKNILDQRDHETLWISVEWAV